MSASSIHISISAEKLFDIDGVVISNSIFTSLIVSALLVTFAVVVNAQLKTSGKPTGLQNFAEWIIEALHNLIYNVTGDLKKTRLFLPLISTFFLFILLNNWFGLLPGVGTIYKVEAPAEHAEVSQPMDEQSNALVPEVHAAETQAATGDTHAEAVLPTADGHDAAPQPTADTAAHEPEAAHETTKKVPLFRAATADLNTTIALALISVVATQIIGFQYLGLGYFKKYINFSSPIMFFVGLLELVLEVAKIMSFAFRLFGNIFAGEVLLVVIAFLIPVVAPMPFYGLELFVGFIQALVFAMLSLVFFNMATIGHEEH